MKSRIQSYYKEIGYFFKNAPLAIMTSAFPGFVNYAVILFLTAFFAMEDVGQYRLLMSYYALMGLFSFQESSKILIRTQATGEKKTSAALFFTRAYGVALVTLGVVLLWGLGIVLDREIIPDGLLPVALIACFAHPAELFISYLQGERKFSILAGLTAAKFLSALAVLLGCMLTGQSILVATLAQISTMALFNAAFFIAYLGSLVRKHGAAYINPIKLVKYMHVREAMVLSFSNWLPGMLEHVDKMIIGYVFGLKVLGLYTLAFSTGRFIYNALKPAFYIYYRHFVESLPSKKLLSYVMGGFTFFGICFSALFTLGIHFLPAFEKFSGGEMVVYVLFLSYGIAMVDAVYCQSYGINKETISHHLLISNTTVSLLCLALFGMCFFVSAPVAMILCAAHFPLRHSGSVFFLSLLKKKTAKARIHKS